MSNIPSKVFAQKDSLPNPKKPSKETADKKKPKPTPPPPATQIRYEGSSITLLRPNKDTSIVIPFTLIHPPATLFDLTFTVTTGGGAPLKLNTDYLIENSTTESIKFSYSKEVFMGKDTVHDFVKIRILKDASNTKAVINISSSVSPNNVNNAIEINHNSIPAIYINPRPTTQICYHSGNINIPRPQNDTIIAIPFKIIHPPSTPFDITFSISSAGNFPLLLNSDFVVPGSNDSSTKFSINENMFGGDDTIYDTLKIQILYTPTNTNGILTITTTLAPNDPNNTVEICQLPIIHLNKNSSSISANIWTLALGANFDLADRIKINSFYGLLSTFDKNLIPLWKNSRKKFFPYYMGLYGAVYQNRYVSLDSSSSEDQYFKTLTFINNDTIKVNRISAVRKTRTTYNNYGLILSFPITFSNPYNGTRSYFALTPFDFEVVLRKTTNTFDYTISASDTTLQLTDYLSSTSGRKPYVTEGDPIDLYDKYWGATMQYSSSVNNFSVFIKATPIGIYWNENNTAYGCFKFYFYGREKVLGVTIGGEIKGIYHENSIPFFNLFVTKTFDIAKIAEALASP